MKGIGTDIVQIGRIKTVYDRQGDRFVDRILSLAEQEIFHRRHQSMAFLANRFAGKEALAKALGTGIGQGVRFVDLEILPNALGQPQVTLSGVAQERLIALGAREARISLSDEKDYAVAFAVLL
ncbi:holo-ACP synthase [Reinekea sp.]|uniref:holo-ACP synthase n=1 Tax=Reinekea sp. TaxID=1970455 RepID=UPI002A83CA82|nr:holo-ACP synthase [Reinekea sp.]